MGYFPIIINERRVTCHNSSDGGVFMINRTPNPPSTYRWFTGAPLTNVSHFVPATRYVNSLYVWQSFRPTTSGTIDSIWLDVEVPLLPPNGYAGLARFYQGIDPANPLTQFIISQNFYLDAGTRGLQRIELFSAPYVEAGQDYTVELFPFVGDMNVGLDGSGSFYGGRSGGPNVNRTDDVVFGIDILEDSAANLISTAPSLTNIPPGKYFVLVTDNANDMSFSSIDVENPPELIVSAQNVQNPSNPVAGDGSITTGVTGGRPPYSFSWNTGDTTPNLSGLNNGLYTLTVQDSQLCVQTKDFLLTSTLASQVRAPAPCLGTVVKPKLDIFRGDGTVYLQALNDEYTEVLHLSEGGFLGQPDIELKIGGGTDNAGVLEVKDSECKAGVCLDGTGATLIAGCEFKDGVVEARNRRNEPTVRMEGATGRITAGGDGIGGELWVLGEGENIPGPDPDRAPLYMNGNNGTLTLNGNDYDGSKVYLRKQGDVTMRLDYQQGTVEITNADFAEEFPVAANLTREEVQPGMVVVLDENGAILPCSTAHDKKAVGIVSGAGTYKPGIVMDKRIGDSLRMPVALAGKVWCWAEAKDNPIREGDLLTTSPYTGFARKAGGLKEAMGAIIGKALRPLKKGESGLIPVKVGLI